MSLRPLCLLAFGLLSAGAAQANIVGPVTWYAGSIEYSCNGELSGRDISEPSLQLCQYYLNQELQDPQNANCDLIEVDPCHVRFHPFSVTNWGEAAPLPFSLLSDFGREERVLRERFHIDQFEAEMGKLRQRLQPAR